MRGYVLSTVLWVGCTSASAPEIAPSQEAAKEPTPAAEVLRVNHLSWAPAVTPVDLDPALVAAVSVRSLDRSPTDSKTEAGPLARATLDVHQVYRHVPAVSPGYDEATARTYTGQKVFVVEGLDPTLVSEGDKLLVFLTSYEGDYALQDVAGTNSALGIRVESWDDPVVDAVRRHAEGAIGAKRLAQALGVESQWPWPSVGIDETWAVAQSQIGDETFRISVPLGLVRTPLPDDAGIQWEHAPEQADGQSLTIALSVSELPTPRSLDEARGRLKHLELDELSATQTPRGPLLAHGDPTLGRLAVHAFVDLGDRPAVCTATFERSNAPDFELVRHKLEDSCASLRRVESPPDLQPRPR